MDLQHDTVNFLNVKMTDKKQLGIADILLIDN